MILFKYLLDILPQYKTKRQIFSLLFTVYNQNFKNDSNVRYNLFILIIIITLLNR